METRPRTPIQSLPPELVCQMQADIAMIQNNANALVEVMTDGFKNRFHVALEDIVKLQFDPDKTLPSAMTQFMNAVDDYQFQIQNIAEGKVDAKDKSNDMVFEKSMQDEANNLKEQPTFQAIKTGAERIERNIGPWVEFKIALASALQRDRDMIPVLALQEGLSALKMETQTRVNDKKADPLRLLEVTHLCEQVQAVINNSMQLSPKQMLTECCSEVEASIANIKQSTYGKYSSTAVQLESLLSAAKKNTIKNGDPDTETEMGAVDDMLGTVRYLLGPKFDAFWVERNSPRGITEMKAMLSIKETQAEALWEKIKEKASERLNRKTLLGYPIDRSKDVADFYFQITKTHLNGLKDLQRRFEATLSHQTLTPT